MVNYTPDVLKTFETDYIVMSEDRCQLLKIVGRSKSSFTADFRINTRLLLLKNI